MSEELRNKAKEMLTMIKLGAQGYKDSGLEYKCAEGTKKEFFHHLGKKVLNGEAIEIAGKYLSTKP